MTGIYVYLYICSFLKVSLSFPFPKDHLRKLSAVLDHNSLRSFAISRANSFHGINDIHTFNDFTEDDMLTIQPLSFRNSDEELGAVGVGASIGHGKKTRLGVCLTEVLISESAAVDRLTTSSVASGKVTTLEHEARDHSVEDGVFEVEGSAVVAISLLAGAESSEVLSSSGHNIIVELESNSASRVSADGNIKEDMRSRHG
jgi:hypothetical protein